MAVSTEVTIRANTTAPIDFQLLNDLDNDGVAETPINLSGAHHVELYLIDKDSSGTVSYSSLGTQLSILAGTAGSLQFTPNGTIDLPLRPNGSTNIITGYFWVYVTALSKYAVPDSFEFAIRVRP